MATVLSIRATLNFQFLVLLLSALPSAACPVLVCMNRSIKCFKSTINETTGVLTGANNVLRIAHSKPSPTIQEETGIVSLHAAASSIVSINLGSELIKLRSNVASEATASWSSTSTSTPTSSTSSADTFASARRSRYSSPPLIADLDTVSDDPIRRSIDASSSLSTETNEKDTTNKANQDHTSGLLFQINGHPILPRRRLRLSPRTAEYNPDADSDAPSRTDMTSDINAQNSIAAADAATDAATDIAATTSPARLANSQELTKTEQTLDQPLWTRLAARLRPRVTAACMSAIWLCPGSLYDPTEGGPGGPGEAGGRRRRRWWVGEPWIGLVD